MPFAARLLPIQMSSPPPLQKKPPCLQFKKKTGFTPCWRCDANDSHVPRTYRGRAVGTPGTPTAASPTTPLMTPPTSPALSPSSGSTSQPAYTRFLPTAAIPPVHWGCCPPYQILTLENCLLAGAGMGWGALCICMSDEWRLMASLHLSSFPLPLTTCRRSL